ncbi:hypothetical protein [Hyphomonas pacifica]|uniref:Uncharacterized protein n=1 Tax=Hyphomonas pacifica TaxID=1280941 RepID=A0A062U526_9PROT|nr:hypothetical protein [Hyphomonas pacifica]KCZ51230.1 hypothetical protein HY2_11790 [Hyphomonas pacifica]RAN33513.1 hypothetical protein HY3_12700 [Hyphomonas pacifica]
MKDTRSASQILFGFLPEQTVDMKGGIWKVQRWHTQAVHDVDEDALRSALISNAGAWEATGRDGDFVRHLRGSGRIRVEALDREKGVIVESFPKTWKCDNCNRLHDAPNRRCKCGNARHGQLPFVLYHDACGAVREPFYPRCPTHGEARIHLPGTTSLYEIRIDCPECNRRLQATFLNATCRCGEQGRNGDRMDFNVHRGATVYTPRGIVIVNPPSKAQARRLTQAGGPGTAAIWLADGLNAPWVDGMQGGRAAGLRRTLAESGLDEDTIERMVAQSGLHEEIAAPLTGPTRVIERVEADAASIAMAVSETRQTLSDLGEHATGTMADLYADEYPHALDVAGIERVDLVERFPVLTGQYGFSRGDHEPGASRLRAFTARDGGYVVYGDVAATEALLIRLKPTAVANWLAHNGFDVELNETPRTAYENILRAMGPDPDTSEIYAAVETLVHSYSHRMVRQSSFYAGIDRNALSELLFPAALAFVTFATPRGDFVLGGLQAMFEYDLHTVLDRVVFDETRCALDPGCASNPSGAACAVCLHLGEPSCRMFNTRLDRKTLFGEAGYFKVVADGSTPT